MTENDILFYVGLMTSIMFGTAIVVRLVTYRTTHGWNQHLAATIDKWRAEGIIFVRGPVGSQFGGVESTGLKVERGIGMVTLTDLDLRITRSKPLEAWIIPFKQIKDVVIERTFLEKKSNKTPFIVIRFTQEDRTNKLGFQVREFESWAKEIAKAAKCTVKNRGK